MDYKKAYEEALERATSQRDALLHGFTCENQIEWLEKIFPELKESEDEKIRKELIHLISEQDGFLTAINGISVKDILAWLEKQGNNMNCIYDKELSELLHIVIRRFINDPDIPYSDREKVSMKVLPYVELLEKQGEQKPVEWSEEDSDNLKETIYFIQEFQKSDRCKNENDMQNSVTCEKWLESLKPQPKHEWSEEDEKNLQGVIGEIEANKNTAPSYDIPVYDRFLSWLKSLRPNHWKPTKEQMEAVRIAAEVGTANNSWAMGKLKEMYGQLQKL